MSTSLLLSLLVLVGFAAQWFAWRTKLPAILYLLICGALVGPGLSIFDPDAVFGELLFPFVSLAVAVILFEGALTLNLAEIKSLGNTVQRLLTLGVAVTWGIITLLTVFLFDVSWGIAILFGAIMVVTGPTVILPLLRTVRPNGNISKILRWEGIVIDPIGALLAVLVFEFLLRASTNDSVSHTILMFVRSILIGGGLGAASGWTLGWLLKKYWIPDYLQSLATLATVFIVYALSNTFAHESGLLAVTIMGLWLANTRGLYLGEILYFKENLSLLLISGLFVILAARIDPNDFLLIGPQALLLYAGVQLLARPISVFISTLGTKLPWQDKALLAWIAPRGIVAAAVSALFALKLDNAQIEGAHLLVPLSFTIIIGTVLVQSLTAKPIARWLNVQAPAPTGFIIVGANPVATAIATEIQALGFETLLCDSNWNHVKAARMAGLNAFYGSPVSEYAEQKLDLTGFGKVLALSPYRELNAIVSLHFRTEFGKNNIYTLLVDSDTMHSDKHRIATEHHGKTLFNKYLTYSKLANLLRDGAEIKHTKLSDSFTFEDYLSYHDGKVIPLVALSTKGRIEIFTSEGAFKPEPGWTLLGLIYQ